MNATELRAENERLRKQLAEVQRELTHSHTELADSQAQLVHVRNRLEEAQAQHEAVTAQFTQTLEEKDRQVASLEHQIKLLLQRIRGSRQERINPDQLLLFSLEELEELAAQLEQGLPEEDLIDDRPPQKRRRRKSPGRVGPLPSHLEREVVRHELSPAERACPCCGELRQEIGVESSEQLELIPAQLKVVQHDRVKYACRRCEEHVAIAPKPPQPIEKGLPAPGLCAHTVLSKFGDHQPMYRQEDVHSRLGMTIRRSTLCGWQAALAELAKPLVGRMKFLVLRSKVIHTDDTSIKMLEPGRGMTRTCKFWPYLGDWLHLMPCTTSRSAANATGRRGFWKVFGVICRPICLFGLRPHLRRRSGLGSCLLDSCAPLLAPGDRQRPGPGEHGVGIHRPLVADRDAASEGFPAEEPAGRAGFCRGGRRPPATRHADPRRVPGVA